MKKAAAQKKSLLMSEQAEAEAKEKVAEILPHLDLRSLTPNRLGHLLRQHDQYFLSSDADSDPADLDSERRTMLLLADELRHAYSLLASAKGDGPARAKMPGAWDEAQRERDEREEPEMLLKIAAMQGKCIMHPEHDSDDCPVCFPRKTVAEAPSPVYSNHEPLTVENLHAIADELRKDGLMVTIEGGGAAIPFLQVKLADGRYVVFGDAAETWGGEIYDSLDALEIGDYLESRSTESPTSITSPAQISAAFRATFMTPQGGV